MRHGNVLGAPEVEWPILNSYPTYEAWKQALKERREYKKTNSYPTYEAWKLIFLRDVDSSDF